MPKSIKHYRDKAQGLAGPHASVSAYRADNGEIVYRIKPDPAICRLKVTGTFHTALTRWTLHMRYVHPELDQPTYQVPRLSAEELAKHRRHAAESLRWRREGDRLMEVFRTR